MVGTVDMNKLKDAVSKLVDAKKIHPKDAEVISTAGGNMESLRAQLDDLLAAGKITPQMHSDLIAAGGGNIVAQKPTG